MKNKINYPNERKKAATALRSLGSILTQHRICSDISPLSSAADQCAEQAAHGNDTWGYDIANLVFRPSLPKGTVPNSSSNFRVELNVSMVGRFGGDADDPFVTLEINVEKFAFNDAGAELKAAWHFDRHIVDTKTGHPRGSDGIHPLYHFQFGGAKMSQLAGQLGSTFLLDPPRLMHPPMDGILAVDFLLANYDGAAWMSLRENSQYVNLIAPQFELIWKPYFSSVAGSWLNPRAGTSAFLCPFVF